MADEIMLNIMQNFKFDFLENEFWIDWSARLKVPFPEPYITFPRDFFSIYRGIILEFSAKMV